MSTHSPHPTQTVPDQTCTHPRPSQSTYSIHEPFAAPMLLSMHSRSDDHHFWTYLIIPDEPKTSQIPLTNPELAHSPPNPKTQYVQLRLGKAQTLSSILDWVSFLFSHTYHHLFLLTLVLFSPVTPFLHQPCIHLVFTIPLLYPYTSCSYPYDYTQTIPSRSWSPVLPSISSLCTLCIPQSEYHLNTPYYGLTLSMSHLWLILNSPTSDPSHQVRPQCPHLHPVTFDKAWLM